jgi:hypothetical protein
MPSRLWNASARSSSSGPGITCDDHADLPRLYTLVARQLNLSPATHTQQLFKQILGGCQTVVEGLAALRNRFGDSHGKGQHGLKPAPRHAELAVNLAGAMATFLVATWSTRPSLTTRDLEDGGGRE